MSQENKSEDQFENQFEEVKYEDLKIDENGNEIQSQDLEYDENGNQIEYKELNFRESELESESECDTDCECNYDSESEESIINYETVYFKYCFEECKKIDDVISCLDCLKEQFEKWKLEGHELMEPINNGYCFINKVIEEENETN